jgi:hypothetical protein
MYLDPLVRRRRLLLPDVCIYPDVIKAVGVIYSLYAPEYGRRNRKESKS